MAYHEISIKLPPVEILNTDVSINVRGDNALIGEITLSRGTLDYRPTGFEKTATFTWEEFDALMRKHLS